MVRSGYGALLRRRMKSAPATITSSTTITPAAIKAVLLELGVLLIDEVAELLAAVIDEVAELLAAVVVVELTTTEVISGWMSLDVSELARMFSRYGPGWSEVGIVMVASPFEPVWTELW
jgi:hypothetical protein